MGRIVGIDLGTTYSAVAIPEERTGQGFMTVPECPGYSIITDQLGRGITPSVVAEDASGNIIVGFQAKARAGLSPEPIMFAKRWMGEEKSFQLARQGTLRPVDVSAHILRYLKGVAEQRLGEPVDEAVITVPAYFSMKAKEMTEEAGKMAGLHVAQIAQEPVAAALMYCMGDARDPLRIMTYDLGGGTFDVAILEKRDGTITTNSIRAFDGDRFLGGYNFDQRLAEWLMDQLNEKGYDLRLDFDKAADKVIFAKLMIYAEQAKIALSKSDVHEIEEPNTGITDHSGNPVAIYLSLTRQQFEQMIGEQIEYTMQVCHRALNEKARPPITPDKIDEIIMVGGSSRIPMIARRLEEEFGKTPKLVRPDLCVALGAAIIAGTKGQTFDYLKLDAIPTETDMLSVTVTGRVVASGALTTAQGCTVTLTATDGSYRSSRTTGAEGAFVFDEVPLEQEETIEFKLTVTSPANAVLVTHNFSVAQTEATNRGQIEGPMNVISKAIGITTVDGWHEFAPERIPLPYETVVHAKTADTSGEIRVPIMEGNNPLGEIIMRDIPNSLPVGSAVEITLTIEENYQIRGRAYVPALGRETSVVIDTPIRPQKSQAEQQQEFRSLQARADDALAGASRGKLFGDAKAKRLKERMQHCQEMLRSRAPDSAAIQDCLDEIDSLVRDIGAGWKPEPPRAAFEQQAEAAEELLAAAVSRRPKVAEDGYDKQLAAIRAEADKAIAAQNTAAWKDSFKRLVQLCERLERLASSGEGQSQAQPQNPAALLLSLARELAALEDWAKHDGRYSKFESDFKDLAAALQRINPNTPDAMAQIRDWYFTKYSNLRRRLDAPEVDGLVKIG
jgi:molecular chaperone DnaK (HSP70)